MGFRWTWPWHESRVMHVFTSISSVNSCPAIEASKGEHVNKLAAAIVESVAKSYKYFRLDTVKLVTKNWGIHRCM